MLPPTFDTYDPTVAEHLIQAMTNTTAGLPGYLHITAIEVGPGRLVCELPIGDKLLNPFGVAHGGVLSALVDHVLGAVCLPVITPGSWPATTASTLNLLAPVRPGVLRAEATIVSLRPTSAVVRVDAINGGRPVGAAQGSISILAAR